MGLVPMWHLLRAWAQRMINARSETLLEKLSRPNLGAEWTRHFNVTRIEVERVAVHGRAPFSVHPGLDPVLVKEAYLSNAPDVAHADILHAVAFVKLSTSAESGYQSKRQPH